MSGFLAETKKTLDAHSQAFRIDGLVVDSIRADAVGSSHKDTSGTYRVADDFIRVLPFRLAGADGRPYGKQYQLKQSGSALVEPRFASTTATGIDWDSSPGGRGTVTALGEEIDGYSGAYPPTGPGRFKKV